MWRRGLVVVAVLSACSRSVADSAAEPVSDSVAVGRAIAVSPPMEQALSLSVSGAMDNASVTVEPTATRMIVRTAELTLQVSDVKRAAQQVAEATKAVDGFLGASRLWREGELDRATMSVRVPAAQLDAMLTRFRGFAVRVDNETVTGEDVTRQAVDLTARLTNLRATETELRALLATVRQRTQRASDILEVHTELARVRGEIEQHTASLQSLTQMAALSTISLDLRPDVVATPIASDAWQPRGVLRDATRALVSTGRVVANGLIWALVYGGPLLLVVTGVVMAGLRLRARQAKSVAPVAE